MIPRRQFLKGVAAGAISAPAILKSRDADALLLHGGDGQGPTFSTFNKPFAANSPWNSKPVNPVTNGVHMFISSLTSPFPANIPFLVYEASPTDPPMTLNVKVPDEFTTRNVTIPHWPADINPPYAGLSHGNRERLCLWACSRSPSLYPAYGRTIIITAICARRPQVLPTG